MELQKALRAFFNRAKVSLHYRTRLFFGLKDKTTSPSINRRVHKDLEQSKQLVGTLKYTRLRGFLASQATINFPQHHNPTVSIIVNAHGSADLTLNCLRAIAESETNSYEVIVTVTDPQKGETEHLLDHVRGAKVLRRPSSSDDRSGYNLAGRSARGEYLLFLDPAVQVFPQSIAAALDVFKISADVGAVGGKILNPDGTLRETSKSLGPNGSCLTQGPGDSPFAPEHMYLRDVDCCAQGFLLTKRDLFAESREFDEGLEPALRAADYCIKLHKVQRRVLYSPGVVLLHHEVGRAQLGKGRRKSNVDSRSLAHKHGDWLQEQASLDVEAPFSALYHRNHRPRILFIEDRVPHSYLGAGYPRSNFMIKELVKLGCFVTLYPFMFPFEDWASAYEDVPKEVEIMLNYQPAEIEKVLSERQNFYDVILISRPHNMATLRTVLPDFRKFKVVYDAEALFCMREVEKLRLKGTPPPPEVTEKMIADEVALAEGSFCVTSVSPVESRRFAEHGFEKVYILSHAIELRPTPNLFELRQNILFVGPVRERDSPNLDALTWFIKEILPIINIQFNRPLKLLVAGPYDNELIEPLISDAVEFLGRVDDLNDLYNQARLFIAPMRFSAGIPLKVYEAAAHGLPVVATTLAANQLAWQHEAELLVASDTEAFAAACIKLYQDPLLWEKIRANALDRVNADCSPKIFSGRLSHIIQEVLSA